jgi:hypothetical protein
MSVDESSFATLFFSVNVNDTILTWETRQKQPQHCDGIGKQLLMLVATKAE